MTNNFWRKKLILPTDFIFGYGSIINEKSRCNNNNINISDVIPARLSKEMGYRRSWNYRCIISKFTALGLEKVTKKKAETVNGVLFPIQKNDLKYFDEREEGYNRIKIPYDKIESCCWINIPTYECNIYTYVPKKENSCNPDHNYPYLQSYLDMCILGCLRYGKEFTEEDRLAIIQMEEEAQRKEKEFREFQSKRSKLSEDILNKQMKRGRRTKKLEEQLTSLLPLIEEANEMSKEMKKHVKFEILLTSQHISYLIWCLVSRTMTIMKIVNPLSSRLKNPLGF